MDKVETDDFQAIPILDFTGFVNGTPAQRRKIASELGMHLENTGFTYITGHAVPESSIAATQEANRRFHALQPEQKNKLAINKNFRGYIPINTSTIITSSVAEVTKPNQSASLMLMHEVSSDDPDALAGNPLQAPNQWPDETLLAGFRKTIETYVTHMNHLGRQLLIAISLALELPPSFLQHFFQKPTTFLRLLHYPSQPQEVGLFGSAPHTDYGFITLLAQDDIGGLQVRNRSGNWINATPVPGAFVMNVGDILARWSNDRFVSTPHRVINQSGQERYSQPFFFDPAMDSRIEVLATCIQAGETAKYSPVNYSDYLMERIDKNYQSISTDSS